MTFGPLYTYASSLFKKSNDETRRQQNPEGSWMSSPSASFSTSFLMKVSKSTYSTNGTLNVFLNCVNSRIFSGFFPLSSTTRTSASIPSASSNVSTSASSSSTSSSSTSSLSSSRFDFRTTELGKEMRRGACFKQSGLCLLSLSSV